MTNVWYYPHMKEKMLAQMLRGFTAIPNGCWQWHASFNDAGYGKIQVWDNGKNRVFRAHRVAYEHFKGAIPDGLCLDHLCHNRGCVNPEHLEPVTSSENTKRAMRAGFMRRKFCKRGHAMTDENIYVSGKIRSCKPCQDARAAAYYKRTGHILAAARYQKRKAAQEWQP